MLLGDRPDQGRGAALAVADLEGPRLADRATSAVVGRHLVRNAALSVAAEAGQLQLSDPGARLCQTSPLAVCT